MRLTEARDRVLTELANGEATASDLVTRFGMAASEVTIRLAVKSLVAEGRVAARTGRRSNTFTISATGQRVTVPHATTFWRLIDG